MINGIVYHGSNINGLQIIEPKVSSHGKSYVYATTNKIIATLFLARWNDYIFRLGHFNGRLHIVENYPKALKEIYKDKFGYIYELSGKNFIKEKNMWGGEVVSTHPVKVLRCDIIENILDKLYEYKNNNSLDIYEYPMRPSCYPHNDSDLLEKFKLNVSTFGKSQLQEFIKYHPNLEKEANDIIRTL